MPSFFEGTGGAAIQGVGSGLSQSIPALRETAKEIRQAPLEAALTEESMAKIEEAKKERIRKNTPIPVENLTKDRIGNKLYQSAIAMGEIDPNATNITVGQKDEILKKHWQDVNVIHNITNQAFDEASNELKGYQKNYDELQKEKQGLDPQKIEDQAKLEKIAEKEKQYQENIKNVSQEVEKYKQASAGLGVLKEEQDYQKLSESDKAIWNSLRERFKRNPTFQELEREKQDMKQKTPTPSAELKGFAEQNYKGDSKQAIEAINTDPAVKKQYEDYLAQRAKQRRPAMRSVPGAPGILYDATTGKYTRDGNEVSSVEVLSQALQFKQAQAEAAQRGGQQAAQLNAANDMYQREAPEIKRLRASVQARGLLPEGGFKDMAAINQWLGKKSSDKETALLQKKTKLMADNLQKTIGGSVGGEWAFKVASDILDPTYDSDTFSAIIDSHGQTIAGLAESRRGFGTKPVSKPEVYTSQTGTANAAIEQLKVHAKNGDIKAQNYLKGKGISWQQ